MITLNAHTARALADERMRDLSARRTSKRPRDGTPAPRAAADAASPPIAPQSKERRALVWGSLAAAARHVQRRLAPNRTQRRSDFTSHG